MIIDWNPKLSTGLSWQDSQHRELLQCINRLHDAIRDDRPRQTIDDVLSFLEVYVIHHFEDEEYYMREWGVRGYSEHKAAHESFIHRLQEMRRKYAEDGVSFTLTLKMQHWLISWLMTHIGRMDQDLALQTGACLPCEPWPAKPGIGAVALNAVREVNHRASV